MKRIIFVTAIVFAIGLSSCEKFLNEPPKGSIIASKYSDYDKLLNNVYIMKTVDYPLNYLTDDVFLPDDKTQIGVQELPKRDFNLYTFNSTYLNETEDDGMWRALYSGLYRFNVIIQDVMKVTDATPKQKTALKSEALLSRAYNHLMLVNIYAKHYNTSSVSDNGIPLRLKPIIGDKLKRASVQEVYKQVLADLDEAEPNLPDSTSAFRGSKKACYALKARTYLYMGEYAKALENANKALSLGYKLLDISKMTQIGQYGNNLNNPENLYFKLLDMPQGLSEKAFASSSLMALLGCPGCPNDKRAQLFLNEEEHDDGSKLNKYSNNAMDINAGIGVPEVMLIAAECEARVGDIAKALKWLNEIRKNRVYGHKDIVLTEQDEVLLKVLNERRIELLMIGYHRLIDIKRLALEGLYKTPITHVAYGTKYTIEPTSLKLVLPIPPQVLLYNPMPQNDRN